MKKFIIDVLDNGLTSQGNHYYKYIINIGKQIGIRGEEMIKIIISNNGAIMSEYPVK